MTKIYTKVFNHKGQFINYYNKVSNNPAIAEVFSGWDCKTAQWIIRYSYKA